MASEQIFHVGVKALIENNEGQILLVLADTSHHKTNTEPYWDIPGGRVQDGDGLLTTLVREIKEETGAKLDGPPQLLTTVISNHQIPMSNGFVAALLLVVYVSKLKNNSKIVLSPEHTAYEWVNKNEAKIRLSDKYPDTFLQGL